MSATYKSNPAKTMLTICVGFLIVYIITKQGWAIKVSLMVGLIGVLSTYLSQKIEWAWMKLAGILGLIVPNILLSIIFYLFLFPIALLSKVFKKHDSLLLKNKQNTMWVSQGKSFEKESMENPW